MDISFSPFLSKFKWDLLDADTIPLFSKQNLSDLLLGAHPEELLRSAGCSRKGILVPSLNSYSPQGCGSLALRTTLLVILTGVLGLPPLFAVVDKVLY